MKEEGLSNKGNLPERVGEISDPFLIDILSLAKEIWGSSRSMKTTIRRPVSSGQLSKYVEEGYFWRVAVTIWEYDISNDLSISLLKASFEGCLKKLKEQWQKRPDTFGYLGPGITRRQGELQHVIEMINVEEERRKEPLKKKTLSN